MFSYVWLEQPKMAKKEPSRIQRLSAFHNLLVLKLYLSWQKCHDAFKSCERRFNGRYQIQLFKICDG